MILRLAGAGSVLGMSAALSEESYETTVETLEPCHVRVVRTSAFRTLMFDFPQVAVAIARSLAEEYKAAFERDAADSASNQSCRPAGLLVA